MEVIKFEPTDHEWNRLKKYAQSCPWISSIYTDKAYRGKRISAKMINTVIKYARQQHFLKAYIPSYIIGLYEKYGFKKFIDFKITMEILTIFLKERYKLYTYTSQNPSMVTYKRNLGRCLRTCMGLVP